MLKKELEGEILKSPSQGLENLEGKEIDIHTEHLGMHTMTKIFLTALSAPPGNFPGHSTIGPIVSRLQQAP